MPEDDFDDEPQAEPKKNFRRELEDRASTAEQEATRLRKENVILKAGLTDLTERQVSVLASQIEGDLTPEAAKALATEFGWFKEEAAAPVDDGSDLAHVTNASSGGTANADPFAALEGIEDPAQFWKQANASGLTTTTS